MLKTKTVIIIVVVSTIISGFLSWGIVEKQNWTLVGSAMIVGAVISYLGTVNFYMHNQFNKIEELVDSYNNSLAKAKTRINNLDKNSKRITREIFNEKITAIDLKLNKIHAHNEIVIEKSDILYVWSFLIKKASRSFYGTNVLADDGWIFISSDQLGIEPQKDAIKRGVDVKRVNFYNPHVLNHKKGILELYDKHVEAGIPSDIKSIEELDKNYTFNSLTQELSTADVVLVDNEILLLTHIDINYEMKYAILCFDENKIKSANDYFQKLFESCSFTNMPVSNSQLSTSEGIDRPNFLDPARNKKTSPSPHS